MNIERKAYLARNEKGFIQMQIDQLVAYLKKEINNNEIEKYTAGRVRTFEDAREMVSELGKRFDDNNIIIDEHMNYLWKKKYGFDRQQK